MTNLYRSPLLILFLLILFLLIIPIASSFVSTPILSAVERESRTITFVKKVSDLFGEDDDPIIPPNYVRNPADGSTRNDKQGRPLTVDRMLGTKPLQKDLLTRPGPGRKDVIYLSGDSVISMLNQIFGYDGWNLQVLETEQVMKEQPTDGDDRWCVAYTAHVRIALTATGTYKEDYGFGDALDRQLPTALSLALKASITDAVKRTARHFGDKLGNCLYHSDFDRNSAPRTLGEALDQFDQNNN